MSKRECFLKACRCQAVDRPPVWMMRQAGRVLPEYRALKEKYTFGELIQSPELAAEVTVQPIRRFGFDAAILFSDILVIPEALGQPFRFRDKGGVEMDFGVRTPEGIKGLKTAGIAKRLEYVAHAIHNIKTELRGQTALIGFAGSPWTLANFMAEGGSAKEFTAAKELFYTNPALFEELASKLTAAVTEFLHMQVDAGVDAVQIFDSLGGLLAGDAFEAASGRWMRPIVAELKKRVPVIVFAKGAHANVADLIALEADILGVDWTIRLESFARQLPARMGVQGNLDPVLLETTPEVVAGATERILAGMRGRPGHIFNLGHGVPPSAKLACLEAVVQTVQDFV